MSRPSFAVVGAGPAGLIAALTLAEAGCEVTVFDQMPSPGRKFLLAGRGGLNLTHSEPFERFVRRYREAAPVLAEALSAFGPDDLRALSAALGEPAFIGSSGRVFPKSFKASPFLRALLRRIDASGARLLVRHRLVGIDVTDPGEPALTLEGPHGRLTSRPRAVLLALGGASWPRLGSDGHWQAILSGAGVELAPLCASNAGFAIGWSEPFAARFAGEPLKRIALSMDGETVRGEAMITPGGLEGGAVYALSAPIRAALARHGSAQLALDLRPDLEAEGLAARLSQPAPGQSLSTRLRKQAKLTPAGVALLRETGMIGTPIPEELAARLKAVPLIVTALMPIERAISSAGGVRLAAIDRRFMVRRLPGVFVAGEMLDWDAPTGGYLLQACFSTGVAAARGMLAYAEAADQAAVQKSPPVIG